MKIICVGRNYSSHALELNNELPDVPLLFLKPETALVENPVKLRLPSFSDDLHYELELVLRINGDYKDVAPENAENCWDELAIGIDLTARDIQSELKKKGHPWEIAKAFDESALVSDFIDKETLETEHYNFKLRINRKTKQDGDSSRMIFSIPYLISYITRYFSLKKGDLIFTGTPEGVGRLHSGDVIEGYLQDKKHLSITIL